MRACANRRASEAARWLAWTVVGLAVALVPLVIWQVGGEWVSNTYGKPYEPFELLGFTSSAAVLGGAAWELRRRRGRPWWEWLPVLLLLLVDLCYITLISEHSIKMWDWGCYEGAARALNEGVNPYVGSCYYYPPFTAQALAVIYRVLKRACELLGLETSRLFVWNLVFYFYQCGQLLMVHLAFVLCYRWARNLGVGRAASAIAVAVLLVCNNALFRTLWYNQVNLWVLNLVLAAVLWMPRWPMVSGLAVALAGHIKLYPLILLGPWTLMRRAKGRWHTWIAVAACLVGAGGIVLMQTKLGRDWLIWQQYLAAPFSDPKIVYFRNNSLYSVIYNILRMAGVDVATSRADDALRWAATLGMFAWFGLRFLERELGKGIGHRVSGIVLSSTPPTPHPIAYPLYPLYGHSADALALALLVSPSAWEHHFVFALPLVLWAIAAALPNPLPSIPDTLSPIPYPRLLPIGLAAALMLATPTFDLFPFSYGRIAGLLLLLAITPPTALPAAQSRD